MTRIEPEEQDFDPEDFDAEQAAGALQRGLELFNQQAYHAAHEEIEKCWLATEGSDSNFYKGLIQLAICMHHFARNNAEGARKLYRGFRGLLGPYGSVHRGVQLQALLTNMQSYMQPVLRGAADTTFEPTTAPRIEFEPPTTPEL